jgi:endonuclease/exonuclease/phosphatase family metal-dependent hydrolase
MPSLATFNANNFFLRYKFTRNYPGSRSQNSQKEASEVALGYLPGTAFGKYPSNYIVWDAERRSLAARALREPDGVLPDILCFQEVENIQAIRILNERYLDNHYPYSFLVDGYDPRNIDVGLLSRFPINKVRSHIDAFDDSGNRIFSRDCLEADIELPDNSTLTLFINHLKSKLVTRESSESEADYQAKILSSHKKRLNQAQHVAQYVDKRFHGLHSRALYAVIGDFNDTAYSPWLAPLTNSPHLKDILKAYRNPDDRWTYYWRSGGRVSQIDFILVSRALDKRIKAAIKSDPSKKPHVERKGLGYRELNGSGDVLPKEAMLVYFENDPVTSSPDNVPQNQKVNFRHSRYKEVMQDWQSNISDHCPVKIWF